MTIGYTIDFTRRNYSRGKMHLRDKVLESVIAPICKSCGITIERPLNKFGRPLRIRDWLKRKNCSKECLHLYRTNPLYFSSMIKKVYKGIKNGNKCRSCGKQLGFYNKERQKERRFMCSLCYQQWRVTEEGKVVHSKFLVCSTEGCERRHECKGLCSLHYQRSLSTNHTIGRPKGAKDLKKRIYPKNRKSRGY